MERNKFRNLNKFEIELLDKLLEKKFPGRDEIKEQLNNCKVRNLHIGIDNYGSVEIITHSNIIAPVDQRVPVEATAYENNVPIEVLLHIVKGKVDELEIFKADGSPIKKMPPATEFKVELR